MPKGICEFEACTGAKLAKGLCKPHYYQQWRGKTLKRTRDQVTPQERFWEKVQKTGECWFWRGVKDGDGYASFRLYGKMQGGHRLAWIWSNGPIPEEHVVDHMCWNRSCVNPAHLRVITQSKNTQNLLGSRADSSTGIRGVQWRGDYKKYRAYARLNGGRVHIGHFDTAKEAERAAVVWRRENMPYSIKDQLRQIGGRA